MNSKLKYKEWLIGGVVDTRASPLREQRKPGIDELNPMTVANVAV
jgi:hypothetical protein